MAKEKKQYEVLGVNENEWDTEKLVRIEGDLFHVVENGGRCGARNRQRGDGSWPSSAVVECTAVGLTEARRLMILFGYDLPTALAATGGR